MKIKFTPAILFRCVFALAILPGSITAYSQADSTLTNFSLKDLLNVKVTTASKTAQSLEMAPATAIVITAEQIRMRGYQSLLDVMYDLPGVKVDDKIYGGSRNNFTIRGTPGQEKLIILLDGIHITSPSGESMPIMENYPVNLAEQIEIVYGPASALYGADAVSGVINIITKKLPNKKTFFAEASSLAGSYGYTNTTLFVTQKLSDRISLVASGQYYSEQQPDLSKVFKNDSQTNIDEYSTGTINTIYGPYTPKAGIRPVYEAPSKAFNIYVSLRAANFSINYFRNFAKASSSWGSNTSNALYNKDAFISQGVETIDTRFNRAFGKVTSITSLSASQYTLFPESNFRNLYTAMEPAYKYATTSQVKVGQQFDFKAAKDLNIIAGGSYELYYCIPYSTDLDSPVNPNEYIHQSYLGTNTYYRPGGLPAQFYFLRYHNSDAYVQMQYSPSQKINLTAGARYDNNSRFGGSFNPRLGLVFKPSDKSTIKLLYGTSFLAPSPSNNYAYWGSFQTNDSGRNFYSYFMHLPNPGLRPITSKNAEFSLQHYFTDNFSATLNGYYTKLTNLHGYADDNNSTQLYNNSFNGIPVAYVEVFVNQSRQKNYGGSLQLNLKNAIGSVKMNSYFSLSYVNGRSEDGLEESLEESPDTELDFISPFIIQAGTDLKAGKFSFSSRVILMGRQHINGTGDTVSNHIRRQTIAGYTLLNLSLRYSIAKRVHVFANISNALNQRYRSVGYRMDLKKDDELFHGQPGDPIKITAGFNLSF
jgi:outer membrane receptor for ferrienterochelin and colicin